MRIGETHDACVGVADEGRRHAGSCDGGAGGSPDEIYLFGFSRGAFTARAVAGMVARCGLVRRGAPIGFAQVFQRYRDESKRPLYEVEFDGPKDLEEEWLLRYSRRVRIKLIGVWDTVGALGIPGPFFAPLDKDIFGFLSTDLHPDVQKAYHALSINERRCEFPATLWTNPSPDQTLEQIWFAGVHSDVGGGYAQSGLSDITLAWMMLKAKENGLQFDDGAIAAA